MGVSLGINDLLHQIRDATWQVEQLSEGEGEARGCRFCLSQLRNGIGRILRAACGATGEAADHSTNDIFNSAEATAGRSTGVGSGGLTARRRSATRSGARTAGTRLAGFGLFPVSYTHLRAHETGR